MIDKAHCLMSPEDEEEYEEFYDFTKTYEDHPSVKKEKVTKTVKEEDAEWEDVDCEDGDEEEEVDEDEADI
jgi:hypothetical protein